MSLKKFNRTVTRANIVPGIRVTYSPKGGKPERGIVKSWPVTNRDPFVVYSCVDRWTKYMDYTAESTPVDDLLLGWHENDDQLGEQEDGDNQVATDLKYNGPDCLTCYDTCTIYPNHPDVPENCHCVDAYDDNQTVSP